MGVYLNNSSTDLGRFIAEELGLENVTSLDLIFDAGAPIRVRADFFLSQDVAEKLAAYMAAGKQCHKQ